MEGIKKLTLKLNIRDKKNRGGYELTWRINGFDWGIAHEFDAGDTLIHTVEYKDPIGYETLQEWIQKSLIFSKEHDTWACDHVDISGADVKGEKFVWGKDTDHVARNSHRAGSDDEPLRFTKFTFGEYKEIKKILLQVKIRDKRNRGGYQLFWNVGGADYSISEDFSRGDLLGLWLTYPTPLSLNALRDLMTGSYIYSKAHDTWACDYVQVSGEDVVGNTFRWRRNTSSIDRNSNEAGPGDNPVRLVNFDFGDYQTYGQDWMSHHFDLLKGMSIQQICLPGSHDAGMSTFHGGTFGASPCNTITQTLSIGQQLRNGIRYFDIRPVISGGNFYTGHYSNVPKIGTQGANGQSIDSIINEINDFALNAPHELILLSISHDLNTDTRGPNPANTYRSFNDDEWKIFVAKIQGINCLYSGEEVNSGTKIETLVNKEKGSVCIIDFDNRIPGVNSNWLIKKSTLNIMDDYSETNKHANMVEDQTGKLRQFYSGRFFVLSWTLTQSGSQAFGCTIDPTGDTQSILDLAANAKENYVEEMANAIEPKCFPSVLYMDDVTDSGLAYMAMWVNRKIHYS